MSLRDDAFPNGALGDARVELQESSGPVSPRYRYTLHVVLECTGGALRAHVTDRAEWRDGSPTRDLDDDLALDEKTWRALWETLHTNQLDALPDVVGDERRKRVGIALNHVAVRAGAAPLARFDYLTSQLDDDAPELARHRAIIAAIKDAAAPARKPRST